MNPAAIFIGIVLIFALSGIRIIYEYKRALKFRFGKYVSLLNPGFRWIIPLVDKIQIVDIRVITANIDKQEVMTKDNVPCLDEAGSFSSSDAFSADGKWRHF